MIGYDFCYADTIEEDVEEWDDDVLGIEECLFCSKISKSLPSNVKHMTSEHSFFIPDIEYLVDLEGFITYLGTYLPIYLCLYIGLVGSILLQY